MSIRQKYLLFRHSGHSRLAALVKALRLHIGHGVYLDPSKSAFHSNLKR